MMKLLVLLVAFLAVSCGNDQTPNVQYEPPVTDAKWAEIAPIVQADCGPCHNGTKEPAFTSGAVFKASAAADKLKAGAMPPPPKTISDADKAKLLAYLAGA